MIKSVLLLVVFLTLSLTLCQAQSSCVNWEKQKELFDKAKTAWTSPACYSFHFEASKFGSESSGRDIQVKNGNAALDGDMSIDEIFDEIETQCLAKCPEEGAYSCDVSYSATRGYPLQVLIDKSQFTVGEETRYTISKVEETNCESHGSPDTKVGGAERSVEESNSRASSRYVRKLYL